MDEIKVGQVLKLAHRRQLFFDLKSFAYDNRRRDLTISAGDGREIIVDKSINDRLAEIFNEEINRINGELRNL